MKTLYFYKYKLAPVARDFVIALMLCFGPIAVHAEPAKISFNIPEKPLRDALGDFAKQANVQVMFASSSKLSDRLVSLNGDYSNSDALAILLANTGFEYVQGEKGDNFAVRPVRIAASQQRDNPMVFTQFEGVKNDEGVKGISSIVNTEDNLGRVSRNNKVSFVEEVVVTAQKREQNVQDVAIALTVFGESAIRELQLTDPIDVGGQTPGLNIRYSDGNTNPVVNIRGVGLNDNNSNNNPSAAVHIDDVYISSSAYLSFPLFDLERIEVLKGPQGTLFGRNTTGGSVNFYTKKPTDETEGYVDISVGNFGAYRVEGVFSGSLTDTLSGRLSLTTIQSDGHQTNVGTIAAGTAGTNAFGPPFPDNPATGRSDHGADDVEAVRIAFDWSPSEYFNLFFSGHMMQDDSDNWIQRLAGPDNGGYVQTGDKSTVSSEFSPSRNADGQGLVLKTTTELTDIQLITITGYEAYDRVSVIDVAGPSRYFSREQDEELWQFTQEVRLQPSNSDKFFWTLGAFYSDDEVDSANSLVFGEPGRFAPTKLLTAYVQEGESIALFAHTEYQLTEALKLTAGLRYTDEEKTYVGGSADIDPWGLSPGGISALPPGGAGIQVSEDYSATDVSGKVGLDWKPSEDVLMYLSFSRGFKSGGFDGSTFTGTPLEATPFDEEILLAYEVGFKSTWADGRLQLNGAAFYYDYEDLQVSLRADFAPGLAGTTRVNAGSATIYGLEIEAVAYPSEELMIKGGISYLDTEVEDVSDIVSSSNDVAVGNEVPDAPELSANLAARYETALSDTLNFSITIDASYRDQFFTNINNSPNYTADDYILVNAKATFSYGVNWEFSLWSRNLFDEEYVISRDLTTSSSPFPLETYGKPRTYGVGVRYSF